MLTNLTERSTPWGGWAVSHALARALALGTPHLQLGCWHPPIRRGHLSKPPLQRAGLRVDVRGRNSAGTLSTCRSPESSCSQAPPARFGSPDGQQLGRATQIGQVPARWGLTFPKPVWPVSHYHWPLKPLLAQWPPPSRDRNPTPSASPGAGFAPHLYPSNPATPSMAMPGAGPGFHKAAASSPGSRSGSWEALSLKMIISGQSA